MWKRRRAQGYTSSSSQQSDNDDSTVVYHSVDLEKQATSSRMKELLSSRPRLMLTVSVFLYLLVVVGISCHIPGGLLHRRSYSKFQAIAAKRKQWAQEYISSDYAYKEATQESISKDVCIITPTYSRKESYLVESAASVLRGIETSTNKHRAFYIVHHVDSEAGKKNRNDLEFLRQNNVPIRHCIDCGTNATIKGVEKEAADMVKTAHACLAYPGVKTIVILEDDAYVALGFIDTVLGAVEKAASSTTSSSQWLYIKLFNTGMYDGFSNDIILELVGTSAVLALCFLLIFSRNIPGRTFCFRFGLYFAMFILSLELLGRQNTILPVVSKQVGVSPLYHFGISTVGLAYNRQGLSLYIEHLTTSPDLELAKLQEDTKATGFVVRPNPVQHIGLVTSIASKGIARRNTEKWYKSSFKESEWFEEYPGGPWMRFIRNYAVALYLLVSTLIFSALNFQNHLTSG